MFGTVLLSVITVLHLYLFWRAASVPLVKQRVPRAALVGTGAVLWTVFLLGRVIGHGGTGIAAAVLEFLGMNWMAALFLMFVPLLAVDLLTLFGLLLPRRSPSFRGWALLLGLALSLIALFQGLRPPVVENYEARLSGLPGSLDGTVIVALSDTHLGSQLGERWLSARVAQVRGLRPDLVVLLGDIFEGHGPDLDPLLDHFERLSAPMGVWAVLGNHEFHGGESARLMEEAGFRLLRNRWEQVRPGLVLAGVDDLTSWHRRGRRGDPLSKALKGRPAGATILLSHSPLEVERAARAGVDLMLAGHTHGGQVWPFDYLVQSRYGLLEGSYDVGGMIAIVSRGAGSWGPRMRLWAPGEIVRVTLRSGSKRDR